ncbi:hypothetical protein EJD97_014354 [Solanum chilense]|uniref:Knottin scorpion toxin-like domain-containing protein n=1 Tax=Solanum chilense TaxID=4083 RepID=A0A6N2B972_SOLCI|nr:hypothetical protein EJD97_014354 [Solanum chilense]
MTKLLICVLLIVTLFFVGAIANEYDCYQIHPEISCDREKVEPKCLTFCRKMFGARADGRCITGSPGLICACYYPC